MTQQSTLPMHQRRPDDGRTHTKREDRVNDQRTRANHPDDDRLTEADLDRHEREQRSPQAR